MLYTALIKVIAIFIMTCEALTPFKNKMSLLKGNQVFLKANYYSGTVAFISRNIALIDVSLSCLGDLNHHFKGLTFQLVIRT